MRVYKNIKLNTAKKTEAEKVPVFSRKNMRACSLLLIVVLSLGVMGFSLHESGLATEVRAITSTWAPNITDLGKLKFVINPSSETDEEVLASISSLAMPFENNYVTEVEAGVFMVDGLGGLVVKACMAGKVTKVEKDGNYKRVTISHGKSLVSVYDYINTVGVEEGNSVEKNTPIGVCLSSMVQFKVLFKNKILAGLTVKDGELTFI